MNVMHCTAHGVVAVDAAIASRRAIRAIRAIRAFLPTPVPRGVVEDILALAARAPSGTNTQPWRVHVFTGAAKERLSRAVRAAYDDAAECARHTEEYAYYPEQWSSPYKERRRKVESRGAIMRACTSNGRATACSSTRRWA